MQVKGQENADWGFSMPEEGWHGFLFLDGIDIHKNEENEKHSLWLPGQFLDAEGEKTDAKGTMFIPMDVEFGERKLGDVLHNAGLAKAFAERFPDDVGMFDGKVIDAVKIKLPGKMVDVKISIREWKGKQQVNFDKVCPFGKHPTDEKSAKKAAAKTGGKPGEPAKATAASDGWDN
uniref:Uncharacterized protein n=1 Tax=viral metagenome TaxID=1070528 RepID=A0A6M3KYM0_9ZZZZ